MKILEAVSKPLARTTPDVWISRVAIFGQLSSPPIRDVPLTAGLNIVWAEEPDDEDDKRDVAGHSAGKTTFCRLLRYILGEKTFANKSNTALIKDAFPNGYVGAELCVKSVKWSVLRPLGEGRASYVLKDSTIEQLIADRRESAFHDSYPEKIGLDALLDRLQSSTVVRTNEAIKWGHLLAWCARDQEARFQNVYDWRSPRSESEWPAFRFPKADPLFVMRVVLGLFLPDELQGEETLSDFQRRLEIEETALDVAKREPAYWSEHYDRILRKDLQKILPDDVFEIGSAPVQTREVLPDLSRFVGKAKYLLGDQILSLDKSDKDLQREADTLNEAIAADKEELRGLEALFKIKTTAGGEIAEGLNRYEAFKKDATANWEKTCPYGNVLIGKCNHVIERRQLLNQTVIKDAHTLEQMEAEQADARAKFESQQRDLNERIRTNTQKRNQLTDQQTQLRSDIAQKRAWESTLDSNLESLISWKSRLDSPEQYEKLKGRADAIKKLKDDISAKESDLNRLLSDHDANRKLLNTIFSTAAKGVLPSSKYDGVANLVERELNFQITHGGRMTGEAMETLAVLLADLSCLAYNAFSPDSFMPGFLLHDSPREADLGLRLYRGYFRFAAQLASEFKNRGGCSFQYIITTTTPPPKALVDSGHVVLQLDASKKDGLLFRRDLSQPPEEQQIHLI